jgi:hypothetical protein
MSVGKKKRLKHRGHEGHRDHREENRKPTLTNQG